MVKILETINLNCRNWHDVNLLFEDQTFYLIAGGNKSGKTELFRILASLFLTENQLICDDVILNHETKYQYIKTIGVIEKVNEKSFHYQKILDEMMYPLYNLHYSKKKSMDIIHNTLKKFKKEDWIEKNISNLNDEEKQILLIMIATLHNPKVLLFDSVLDGLNNQNIKLVMSLLRNDGFSIISFDVSLRNLEFFDKIIIINNHQIIKEMDVREVFNDDKIFYDNHLEIPFMYDLSIKLKMYNIINKNYHKIEEMVDDIWD